MLVKEKLNIEAISAIIGRGKSVVQEYVAQAQVYHPELFEVDVKESQGLPTYVSNETFTYPVVHV